MKPFAIVVALTCFTGSAIAADMPVKASPPPAAAPAWNWSGFYVGLNAGYGWGRSAVSYVPPGIPFTNQIAAYSAIGSATLNPRGFTGGVQAGYNWQTGPVVFGLEGDFGAFDLRSNFVQTGTPPVNDTMIAAASVQTNWLATLRARLGFTLTDRLLVYVTGGGAWTNFKYSETNNYINGIGGSLALAAFNTNTTNGAWTTGGGFEYGILPHWSIKAEYLYANFGSVGGTATALGSHLYTANLKTNIARAGINYHFW